eukprot:Skav236845  [mRNA]  locus=scaffold1027:244027:244981:+ [translate_table: standard]
MTHQSITQVPPATGAASASPVRTHRGAPGCADGGSGYQRHLRNVAQKQRPCDLAVRKSAELTTKHRFSVEDERLRQGEQLEVIDQVRFEELQSEHQRRPAVLARGRTSHGG